MGAIDDIKKMQGEGKSDFEIRETLRSRGLSTREIEDAFSQGKIKEAVQSEKEVAVPDAPNSTNYFQEENESSQYGDAPQQGFEGMQPSLMDSPSEGPLEQVGGSSFGQDNYNQGGVYYDESYSQYQPYQSAVSSDVISEISEQIVDERISFLKEKIEKALDFRTAAEARINSVDERLKRMEKIIDRLQVSVLQKVGDYINDVRDIKKEIQETQKSVKAVHRSRKQHKVHKAGHPHHAEHFHAHKKN